MPSSPKVPKEKILKTALELLIDSGYENVNIKAIAQRLHCSTQPISWQFGNMEGLRQALAGYALDYAKAKMLPTDDGLNGFAHVGAGFVDLAFDEPHLFRYLYYGDSKYRIGGLENIASIRNNAQTIDGIAAALRIDREAAALFLTNTVIYSTGILSMVVSGVLQCDRATVKTMINGATNAFLLQAGADLAQVKEITRGLEAD